MVKVVAQRGSGHHLLGLRSISSNHTLVALFE